MLQDWTAQPLDVNIIKHVWDKIKEEAWRMKLKNLDEFFKIAFFKNFIKITLSITYLSHW